RDYHVTGVQTCAPSISPQKKNSNFHNQELPRIGDAEQCRTVQREPSRNILVLLSPMLRKKILPPMFPRFPEFLVLQDYSKRMTLLGRAPCRERVATSWA